MHLGGARCSAAAIPAGAPAQEDDHISGLGLPPQDICPGSRRHYRADLHSFCHIAGVIYLVYKARGKAHLVAVGGIAVGGLPYKLLLGELALKGL